MARTKQTARKRERSVVTWTRFHLPKEQEWPTWAVAHEDVHVGPLADIGGAWKVWLGRMMENPEQAAYIIKWRDLENLKKFQSSAACAEFLQNLPENDSLQVSIENSTSALSSLTVEDASSSSSPPAPASSRFLILQESTQRPAADVEGRVTFNAFLVPRKPGDDPTQSAYQGLRGQLCNFQPRGSEFIRGHGLHWQDYMTTWFWMIEEDNWVQSKFGKLEQTEEHTQGRAVICEFHLWPRKYGATPEHEEASAADPEARKSWNEAVAKVMPPVTAWVQERWDISEIPRYEPPWEPDEEELEQERKLQDFLEYHRQHPKPEVRWCGTRW
ncbi:hypothetical protein B0T21DRAFT_282270 [Apiosordaria backusii]|uniref:ABM domain-containing protein n=1 Tax=Apiosordaria backusii TaxID=314023 RepID=A0AA40EMQ6_9PEZI|nr:hypothetical protein B0T21DRAFT_282270 [Apiosordaria backusii]